MDKANKEEKQMPSASNQLTEFQVRALNKLVAAPKNLYDFDGAERSRL